MGGGADRGCRGHLIHMVTDDGDGRAAPPQAGAPGKSTAQGTRGSISDLTLQTVRQVCRAEASVVTREAGRHPRALGAVQGGTVPSPPLVTCLQRPMVDQSQVGIESRDP